jgi:hypothetical protein
MYSNVSLLSLQKFTVQSKLLFRTLSDELTSLQTSVVVLLIVTADPRSTHGRRHHVAV